MKTIQKTLLVSALLMSATAFAQNAQWQVQIGTQPPPQAVYPVQAPLAAVVAPAPQTVESIQAQQDARIRWGVQRGFINDPEHRRLAQMQTNIEHNRRIAYADSYFDVQEQQFIFGQLNQLSAEIDKLMLNGNFAPHYYQQFNTPIPVWTQNHGWQNGRYEVRAEEHHRRGYRPMEQAPLIQQPPAHVQAPVQTQQQPTIINRPRLRDVLDPLGLFR
jgi:hypothetical protein